MLLKKLSVSILVRISEKTYRIGLIVILKFCLQHRRILLRCIVLDRGHLGGFHLDWPDPKWTWTTRRTLEIKVILHSLVTESIIVVHGGRVNSSTVSAESWCIVSCYH